MSELEGFVLISLIDEEPMTVKEFMCSKYFKDGMWELYKGELVAMSPSRVIHDVVVMRIAHLFQGKIEGGSCVVGGPTAGMRIDDDDSFVCPDIFVCCDKSIVVDGWLVRSPELIVEVLSRSTKKYDLFEKKDLYRDCGAKEFWAVSIDDKSVYVENFQNGLMIRFGFGDVVKSWLFPEFEFGVDSLLRNALES